MKTKYNLLVLIILTLPVSLSAQLVVNSNTLSTNQLVQDVLVGQGMDVSNVTFNGVTIQRGFFDGSNSNIGINSGVILATGNIFVATGPNDLVNATQPEDSGCGTPDDPPPFVGPGGLCRPGDADLNNILAGSTETFDAAVLEFDFIPQSDFIRLNYVFASEEYPEYVCSDFNDLFAFLLSGPNPTGGIYNEVNIARIPDTNLPVGINTINSGIPGGAFGCDGAEQSLDFTALYNNNDFGESVQFDGFTEKLEAVANVIPCETYHIKIAIADAGDGVLDSAVFLEENSFATDVVDIDVVIVDTENNMETSSTTLPEDCGHIAEITFSLSNPASTDFNIPITVSGTATNGTDYATLPDNIFIPAGESEVTFVIEPLEDGIEEGIETIIFEVQTSVCESLTFTISIGEAMALPAPVMLCGIGTAVSAGFEWQPVSGATGYEVSEDGGMTWIMPSSGLLTHNFAGIGQGETVELLVRAIGVSCEDNPASAILCSSIVCSVDAQLAGQMDATCNGGNDGFALVTVSNGVDPLSYQWDVNADNQNSDIVFGLGAGTYNVTVTDALLCSSVVTVQISEPSPLEISMISDDEGSATALVEGGTPPYIFQWNDPNNQITQTAIGLDEAQYTVTVTDLNGCTNTGTIDLAVNIETPEYLTHFDISPNPSTGKFTIDLQFEVTQTATIQVLNTLGQQMYHFTDTQTRFFQTIDMNEAAAGTYFVVIRTESGRVVKRVILI